MKFNLIASWDQIEYHMISKSCQSRLKFDWSQFDLDNEMLLTEKKIFSTWYICKTGNGWQNTLLADEAGTGWRGWHWLTGLTLAEENNFWLIKLILLIEKIFYESY
jgi:hypothetical protein